MEMLGDFPTLGSSAHTELEPSQGFVFDIAFFLQLAENSNHD